MKRTCKQCGKEFELSESEISFYKSKGLELPKRCKSCRDKNKGIQQPSGQKQKIVSVSQSNQSNQYDQNNNQNHHQNNKSYVVISAVAALLVLLVFVLKSVFAIPSERVHSEDAVSSNIQVRKETPVETLSETPAEMLNEAPTETFANVPSNLLLPEEKDEGQTKEQPLQQTEVQAQPDTQKETPAETEIAAVSTTVEAVESVEAVPETPNVAYHFRKPEYLTQHFQKHGAEFPYATEEEYLLGANNVIQNPNALHKLEAEDGDDVYYIESTREFVIVSTDGYIRTYYTASLEYFNRQ